MWKKKKSQHNKTSVIYQFIFQSIYFQQSKVNCKLMKSVIERKLARESRKKKKFPEVLWGKNSAKRVRKIVRCRRLGAIATKRQSSSKNHPWISGDIRSKLSCFMIYEGWIEWRRPMTHFGGKCFLYCEAFKISFFTCGKGWFEWRQVNVWLLEEGEKLFRKFESKKWAYAGGFIKNFDENCRFFLKNWIF